MASWYKYSQHSLSDQVASDIKSMAGCEEIVEQFSISNYIGFVCRIDDVIKRIYHVEDMPSYQLGITRFDKNPASLSDQLAKSDIMIPANSIDDIMIAMGKKIKECVTKYGPMLAGSMSDRKNAIYQNLIKMINEKYNIGLSVKVITVADINLMVIS